MEATVKQDIKRMISSQGDKVIARHLMMMLPRKSIFFFFFSFLLFAKILPFANRYFTIGVDMRKQISSVQECKGIPGGSVGRACDSRNRGITEFITEPKEMRLSSSLHYSPTTIARPHKETLFIFI